MLVREFLAKNKTVIMPQPPYSPDLENADIFLESGAVGDIEKRVSEVNRGLEKTLA